jgi:hypothetical protein
MSPTPHTASYEKFFKEGLLRLKAQKIRTRLPGIACIRAHVGAGMSQPNGEHQGGGFKSTSTDVLY